LPRKRIGPTTRRGRCRLWLKPAATRTPLNCTAPLSASTRLVNVCDLSHGGSSMKRSGSSRTFGRLVAGVFLLHRAAAAQEQRPSYYPEKPKDDKAVYLAKDSFPVHADGIGDDTVAIQRAIDRVRSAGTQSQRPGAGIVFIPEGRYRLSQTIY